MTALKGKVAIVTGASSGIGRAAALLFAHNGARVVAGARRQAALDDLVAQIRAAGGEACSVAGDVRDETFAQRLVQQAVEHFGGLDVAFNNAGTIGESGPTPNISAATANISPSDESSSRLIPTVRTSPPETTTETTSLASVLALADMISGAVHPCTFTNSPPRAPGSTSVIGNPPGGQLHPEPHSATLPGR